jgi:hypothetical protein
MSFLAATYGSMTTGLVKITFIHYPKKSFVIVAFDQVICTSMKHGKPAILEASFLPSFLCSFC